MYGELINFNMSKIIPAILPQSFEEIKTKIAQVKHSAKLIQIDICDGVYVPSRTWPFIGEKDIFEKILLQDEGMPFWQEVDIELDLMVKNAHKKFLDYIALGPTRMIFHLGAEDSTFLDFLKNLDEFYKHNLQIGIAINPTTEITLLLPFVPHIQFVQCMGIEHPGVQGAASDVRVFDQIKKLRQEYPSLPISVDGSVSFKNIDHFLGLGVENLVVGSAIFKTENPEETYLDLDDIAAEYR